ncbi:MAG: hypothetical protein DHS20C12_15660 [Pseudohongiella sp.]|nr:MAG: hypothetical protein DHS20C12_15660 [Pseudohongiella sp.]
MNDRDKIRAIEEKLALLRELDGDRILFGAKNHNYSLNETLSESEIASFEKDHSIILPQDYRLFLLRVGNGGAGPYYGLERLEDALFADLDNKEESERVDPSTPFPLSEPWKMRFDGDEEDIAALKVFEEEYFAPKWETGLLRIANYGCGVWFNLIVNGPEFGNIWVDDRAGDGGLFPDNYYGQTSRTTFLDWYELWLDESLHEAKVRSGT